MVFRTSCCIQIILASHLLAGDYYVTYSLSSQQLLVSSEKLTISRAMVSFNPSAWLFESKIENSNPISKTEHDFIKEHKEEILHELMSHEVSIKSNQTVINLNQNDKTELKIKPTPLRIEFNDDFVTIKIPRGNY